MPSFNKVILAGNITRAPELRYTPKGTAICRVGIAVNRHWTSDSGEKKEEVVFVDVDFWGETAETVTQYFRKGSAILIEGRLKLDQWKDKKTNEDKQRLGVVGESFSFVDSKQPDGNDAAKGKRAARPAPATAEAPAGEPGDDGDDVPF